MRSPSLTLIGATALSLSLSACGPEPIAPPNTVRVTPGDRILTSFDRVTLARRERARFRAAVVSAGALSSAGLSFVMRDPSVASLAEAGGRAQVQGLATGRTWVLVQRAAAADSVEVIVQ
jgi:hypothetical protein